MVLSVFDVEIGMIARIRYPWTTKQSKLNSSDKCYCYYASQSLIAIKLNSYVRSSSAIIEPRSMDETRYKNLISFLNFPRIFAPLPPPQWSWWHMSIEPPTTTEPNPSCSIMCMCLSLARICQIRIQTEMPHFIRTAVIDFVSTERERIVSKKCIFFLFCLHLRRRTTSHSFSLLLLLLLSLQMQTKLASWTIATHKCSHSTTKKNFFRI